MKLFKKSWMHIFIWAAMVVYFIVAPGMYTRAFTKDGKPHQIGNIPRETDRITFVVDGFVPDKKDGQSLYNLFGWAFIAPGEDGISSDRFIREVVLISEGTSYSFPATTNYRRPQLPDRFATMKLDWETLGYNTLVADDLIEPGKYRVGMVFRDKATGEAFYRDKPVYYLVKTPNTIRLEKNK
jgi:hypothetical protein